MCHEISGKKDSEYSEIGKALIGSKTIMYEDGQWISVHRDYVYLLEEDWFKDNPKTQGLTFLVPMITGKVKEVKSDCLAGMHISPFTMCGMLNRLYRGTQIAKNGGNSLSIIFCEAPVLFRLEDILFYDGKDVSVKAFRLPDEAESKTISDKIFPGKQTEAIPFDNLEDILMDHILRRIDTCGFPYFVDGNLYILLEKE